MRRRPFLPLTPVGLLALLASRYRRMEISPRTAILSAAVIPFRQGGGEGMEKRDAGKNREGEHIGVGVRKKMDVSLLFFPFLLLLSGFRLLSRLGNDTAFRIFGNWKFPWIWLSSTFFFFSVSKLILNSNFRYEAKSFSKNNRDGREI